MFTLRTIGVVTILFGGMLALEHCGSGLRERHRVAGLTNLGGAAEAAVFGLLGLFLAFTFSGAGTRYDQRRHLIVDEANAIGTAWLRIDILPEDRQPEIRDLFRKYLDARLETYRLIPDVEAAMKANAKALRLQRQIWSASVIAARSSPQVPPFTVFLPSLNAMIDIATTRTAVAGFHPPGAVFMMIGFLSLIAAVFAGYAAGGTKHRSWLHTYGFAAIMAVTLYVIFDLEYPRFGLIRVDAADQVLVDVRNTMN